MTGLDTDAALVEVLKLEYQALKTEQTQRITTRDNLIYPLLAVIGGIAVGILQAGAVDLLLVLPPACAVFGWKHLDTDRAILAARRYIEHRLAPRLKNLTRNYVLGWEVYHRTDRRRRQRKTIQLAVDMLTFVVPGALALALWAPSGDHSVWAWAGFYVDLVVVCVLEWQMLVHANLRPEETTT